MKKAIFIFVAVLLLGSACAEEQTVAPVPQWLTDMIHKNFEGKKTSVLITEREYRGQDVFVIDRTAACCDLGAEMFDRKGETICSLIGFAGFWENKCRDFPKNNKLIRTIYEDE